MQNIPEIRKKSLLLLVWIILFSIGFWKLFDYANTPGLSAKASPQWPKESRLIRDPKYMTLVMFGHPRCPCSRASVTEIERLMPHLIGKVKSYIVFVKPKNQLDNWAKEDLWKKAESIPEITTTLDIEGMEAAQFDAHTSGQTFLYDQNGHLVFQGGITSERGHLGDSDGRNSILSFVETGHTKIAQTHVFGCSLLKPERSLAGEDE